MTSYEIISINIEILTLMITFGGLIIAILSFHKKRKDEKE